MELSLGPYLLRYISFVLVHFIISLSLVLRGSFSRLSVSLLTHVNHPTSCHITMQY